MRYEITAVVPTYEKLVLIELDKPAYIKKKQWNKQTRIIQFYYIPTNYSFKLKESLTNIFWKF